MERETSSLVSLGIVLIAVAVVITLGFGIFAVGKRLANQGQNDLVSQIDQINQSTFTDMDQQVVTGTRLKGVISQLGTGNYAILINTLALRNNQGDGSTLTGDLWDARTSYQFVETNLPTESAKGTDLIRELATDGTMNTWVKDKLHKDSTDTTKEPYTTINDGGGTKDVISNTIFVNYNAILKNASVANISDSDIVSHGIGNTSGNKGLGQKTPIEVRTTTDGGMCDDSANGMRLMMNDGIFTTELEFQIDTTTGNVLKNTRQADFNKQGTTMYIADGAQFNSYVIKDATNNYVGLAFCQIQR